MKKLIATSFMVLILFVDTGNAVGASGYHPEVLIKLAKLLPHDIELQNSVSSLPANNGKGNHDITLIKCNEIIMKGVKSAAENKGMTMDQIIDQISVTY